MAKKITVLSGSQKFDMDIQEGESILDAALRAGIDIPFGCQSASCGTCMAKVIDGEVTLDDRGALEESEIADGLIYTCVARATSAHCTIKLV